MSLLRLVLVRVLLGLAALALVSVAVFAATEVLPGDAAAVVAGPDATPEQRERVRERLGLDRPATERYVTWLGGALRGDLGTAFVGGRPVAEVIGDRLGNSAVLGGLALVIAVPIGVAVGAIAGAMAGRRTDRAVSTGALVLVGVPEFISAGVLLVVLASWLGWFPAVSLVPLGGGPLDAPSILVLPAVSMALAPAAFAARLTRATVADTVRAPFVETARLNGVVGPRLFARHVVPNSLGPVVQVFGLAVGSLIGGAVVVESLFAYPGIGSELRTAVLTRDLPLVQGIALVLAAITLAALLVADVTARLVDPRLRGDR